MKLIRRFIDELQEVRLFRLLDLRFSVFLIPSLLALLASIGEGASLALLIPTIKGLLGGDYLFAAELPVMGPLLESLFEQYGKSQGLVFAVLVGCIFVSVIAKNFFQYLSLMKSFSIINDFTHKQRQKIYDRYLSFGKLFFDKSSSGNLYQVLVGFTQQISEELTILQWATYSFFSLIVYLVIMLSISWELTLCTLTIFPLLIYGIKSLLKRIEKGSSALAESRLDLAKKISNALSCVPLVKAYSGEEREKEWFGFASRRVRDLDYGLRKKLNLIQPVQEVINLSMMLILVALAVLLLVEKGKGDPASYLVFFLLLRRVSANFGGFTGIRATLARIKGPLKEILSIYDDEDKFFVPDGTLEFEGIKSELSFNHLTFQYPAGAQAIHDLCFSLSKGKTTALVGASGSGKSTLINLIMRYYDSPAGSILIDGKDIRSYQIQSLRSKIALVSQETLLFNAPLQLNLTYGLKTEPTYQELQSALKRSGLKETIEGFPKGLKTEVGERGVKLSGGEKQRVSICRAILKNAEIILLDEATSALDSVTERLVQAALSELTKNVTTIVIAHRLSTVKNAEKIVVIENGELKEQGSLEELLAQKGKFSTYWNEQIFI